MMEKKPIQTFLEGSSMKGVPKIVKAKFVYQKCIWMLALALGLGIGGYQLVSLLIAYFSYQTTIASYSTSEIPPFPDVTVCNLQMENRNKNQFEMYKISIENEMDRLISEHIQSRQKRNTNKKDSGEHTSEPKNEPKEYDYMSGSGVFPTGTGGSSATEEQFAEAHASLLMQNDSDYKYLVELYTKSGFFQSQGNIDEKPMTKLRSFIIGCDIAVWDVAENWDNIKQLRDEGYQFRCDDDKFVRVFAAEFVEEHFSSKYGTCFTFSPGASGFINAVEGLSLLLYLDDFGISESRTYFTSVYDNYSSGVKVLIHEHGTMPDMSKGFNVAPGYETTIFLETSKIIRLQEPYDNCTYTQKLQKNTYSQSACKSLCVQERVIDHCSCIDGTNLFHEEDSDSFPFCWKFDGNLSDTVKNMECRNEITATVGKSCGDSQCPLKCEEYLYSFNNFQVPWPHSDHLRTFYFDVIMANEYIESMKFQYYEVLYHKLLSSRTDAERDNHLQEMKNYRLIESNFVNLKVVHKSMGTIEVHDKPALGASAFGGSMGGILNLWMGISFVTFIEVVELIFNYLVPQGKKTDPAVDQHDMDRQMEISPIEKKSAWGNNTTIS